MPEPTTTPDTTLPLAPEVTEPEAPRQPKKAAERIADLEQQLALMNETAAQNATRAVETADRIRTIERNLDGFARGLDEKLGPLLARLGASPEDVQKAIDTTPARPLGQLLLDDRMSEAEILERVRAIRAGKLAPDKATRFRTDARIYPDRETPLHAKHAGTTIPLRTEVTRADFSPESLDQHIATGALIPIA